jgi:alkylhydroperoxidase family enzyme
VRRHAFKVTDDDVQALRSAGYSEDQIFEMTVAAAYGAAAARLASGLRAMAGPSGRTEG